MEYLGFFMNNFGELRYFGEWAEQYDKHIRKQVHTFSFEDEILGSDFFKKLNLDYNPECGLFGWAVEFALQGMITLQNTSSDAYTEFFMHVPYEPTKEQINALNDLFPLLTSFDKCVIVKVKSRIIASEDQIKDVYDFYTWLNSLEKDEDRMRK